MAQLLMLDGHAEFKTVEEMTANAGNFWAVLNLGAPSEWPVFPGRAECKPA